MSDLSQIDLTVDLAREIDGVNKITANLGVSYVVLGATARDLVLHHGFGLPLSFATLVDTSQDILPGVLVSQL